MTNNLRKIRLARGLSQEKLGEMVNATSQQIGHLERGSRGLNEAWLRELSAALGCSMAEILGEELDLDEEEVLIVNKFRGMSERDRQRFIEMTKIMASNIRDKKSG